MVMILILRKHMWPVTQTVANILNACDVHTNNVPSIIYYYFGEFDKILTYFHLFIITTC